MGFLDFLKNDNDGGKIIFTDDGGKDLSAEEAEALDSMQFKKVVEGELSFKKAEVPIATTEKSIDSKEIIIKNIKEISGLTESEINIFYEKMNDGKYKVQEMLENILATLTEREIVGKNAEELVMTFKKQVSGDNLARVVAAFIILIERGDVEKVLIKKSKKVANLGAELEEMGISID